MRKLFMLLPVLFLSISAFAQQDNTSLMDALFQHPDVKEYFKGQSLYAILASDQCNAKNTDVTKIKLDKPVFIGLKEDLFMRKIETFIQVKELSLKGKFAKAKVYFESKGQKVFRLQQLGEGWEFRSQLDDINR